MQRTKPSAKYDDKTILHNIGDSLKNGKINKNKDNYSNSKVKIEAQIDLYEDCINKHVVFDPETINALWSKECPEKKTAHDMYSDSREDIVLLKNELKTINGNGKPFTCPICGLYKISELDHYIPRGVMPEFSVYPKNLIYICHHCNHEKLEKWLDEHSQKRLFFNSYYDNPTGEKLLSCSITIENGLPHAKVSVETYSLMTPELERELTTIDKLGLVVEYEEAINEELAIKVIELKNQFLIEKADSGISASDFWNKMKKTFSVSKAQTSSDKFKLLYEGLLSSSVMEGWLETNI